MEQRARWRVKLLGQASWAGSREKAPCFSLCLMLLRGGRVIMIGWLCLKGMTVEYLAPSAAGFFFVCCYYVLFARTSVRP